MQEAVYIKTKHIFKDLGVESYEKQDKVRGFRVCSPDTKELLLFQWPKGTCMHLHTE